MEIFVAIAVIYLLSTIRLIFEYQRGVVFLNDASNTIIFALPIEVLRAIERIGTNK